MGFWDLIFKKFYPRPPRGGRLFRCCATGRCRAILSTPSARRATAEAYANIFKGVFYPRPPRGGRLSNLF